MTEIMQHSQSYCLSLGTFKMNRWQLRIKLELDGDVNSSIFGLCISVIICTDKVFLLVAD